MPSAPELKTSRITGLRVLGWVAKRPAAGGSTDTG